MSLLLLPWFPKIARRVEAAGLPNDEFWTDKMAISISKVTTLNKNALKTNLQKPTCLRKFHRKPKNSKHTKNSKLSKATELAQHSYYHTALFLRVGAGSRGRNP